MEDNHPQEGRVEARVDGQAVAMTTTGTVDHLEDRHAGHRMVDPGGRRMADLVAVDLREALCVGRIGE